jgi:hypothetical protein
MNAPAENLGLTDALLNGSGGRKQHDRAHRISSDHFTGESTMIGKHCIVRTYAAGVFAGILKSRDGTEVVLTDARRIWYWDGAASLSQLAFDGTSNPQNCKFPIPVPEILLTQVIEIIPTTDKARKSIAAVPVWKK